MKWIKKYRNKSDLVIEGLIAGVALVLTCYLAMAWWLTASCEVPIWLLGLLFLVSLTPWLIKHR